MTLRPSRLLALLLALSPIAVAATVEDGTFTPEEHDQFVATMGRYRDRMRDFNVEASLIAQAWEAAERARVAQSYAATIDELTANKTDLRDQTIQHFEGFLAKYPAGEYTPHIMFRLAELYFEVSEEEYSVADAEFNRAAQAMDSADLDSLPVAPGKNYKKPMGLYKRIVADYPSYRYADGAYYMLGYCYSELLAEQYDEKAARASFTTLVETYPTSDFANQANLRLGDYFFDENNLEQAIVHYNRVVDQGPKANLYDRGLYKLAWANYKKATTRDEYISSLGLFTQLLDYSEQRLEETGKPSDTAPEAIQYVAIAFSDMAGTAGGLLPQEEAKRWFLNLDAPRAYEDEVIKKLAEVLTQQSRYDDAIATYEYIQQRWPDDPDNPTYQRQIALLYSNMPVADPEAIKRALMVLNDRYSDDSLWAAANRNNPDAVDKARKYIEESLVNVAVSFHDNAMKTGDRSSYDKAADLYKQYLEKFPFANDYYEIENNLADIYYDTDQFELAETTYGQILKSGSHDFNERALWRLMQTRRKMLIADYGKVEALPPDAVEESRVTLPSGKERIVYKIDDRHMAFIKVCDQLVNAQFTQDEELTAALNDFRSALAYLPAQIYYYYGHYDEARPRFDKIIATWPDKNDSAFSATLVVDSYTAEENLMMVRTKSAEFARLRLGEQEVGAEKVKIFKDLQEGATFKLAEALVAQDKRAEAADAYVAFMGEFPNSKYVADAHYNAGYNYEVIGRIDEANRLFEEYVNKYPKDERSQYLFYRIAANYSGVLELDKAVRYYDTLVANFPKYVDAPTALYNAAFLRVGLGDAAGAAKNYERYAKDYPNQPDAEQVEWLAADQWERVSNDQALSFYQRYLRAYPDTNPDHAMEAWYRIAKAAEKTGNQRAIDKAWDDIAVAYARLNATGRVGPAGRHYAANAEFRKVLRENEAFKVYKYTKDDDKNAKLMLEEKKAALESLINHAVSLIETYSDFETSAGALFVQGDAYYAYDDMLFKYPCPPKFDEEMCTIFAEQLDTIRLPVEDKGKNRLLAALELANKEHRWSEWHGKTLTMLNERDPANYGTDKQELRGQGDSNLVPTAGAMELPKPAAPAAPTAPAPTVPAPAAPAAGQETP